jgi:tRNA(Ile)-lysidine synthase
MKIEVAPGRYIVAVSGGVDSMVLLDLLRAQAGAEIIVAHFDHGIRDDAKEDRKLVQKVAASHKIPFVYEVAKLGKTASEETARKARYAFLDRSRRAYGAKAIITAHHQDDVLETAAINLLRGTNRRGLSSLASSDEIVRPLLEYPKAELTAYAKKHKLSWREDSTNKTDAYLRNAIRKRFGKTLTPQRRQQFLDLLRRASHANAKIEVLLLAELVEISDKKGIKRREFNRLNHALAREILALWLRREGLYTYDKKLLERLVVAAKIAHPGSNFDVQKGITMHVTEQHLALQHLQR